MADSLAKCKPNFRDIHEASCDRRRSRGTGPAPVVTGGQRLDVPGTEKSNLTSLRRRSLSPAQLIPPFSPDGECG